MIILEKLLLVREMITQPVVYYKMVAIDLSKQQVFHADPRAIQQIRFTANLDRAGNTTMFFIIEEPKGTSLDFSQGTVKVLYMYIIKF